MNNERIIRKLKALLARTTSHNEHEAATAMRQLHLMLAKYNLDITDVQAEDNPIGEEKTSKVYCRPWKKYVGMYIAKLYFCRFYYTYMGKSKSVYTFVGTESNRLFATHIFNMIIKTVERESRKASREKYGREVCSFVNSFWLGAQDRIIERCEELITAAKEGTLQDEEGNTLPALLSVYENNELMISDWLKENLNLTSKKQRQHSSTDHTGYIKGQDTGDKVQLSRTLQGKQSPKMIGG